LLRDGASQTAPENFELQLQRMVRSLHQKGLLHWFAGSWYLRRSVYDAENERAGSKLTGWSVAALEAQLALLGRIEGVELDARSLSGARMRVFTRHRGAVGEAAFVALSPLHPELEQWLGEPLSRSEIERLDAAVRTHGEQPDAVVVTSSAVQVAGVPKPLPVIVWSLVERECGPGALLGTPSADARHAAAAEHLGRVAGASWRIQERTAEPQTALRHSAGDVPIARGDADADAIAIVREMDPGFRVAASQLLTAGNVDGEPALLHERAAAGAVLTQRMLTKALCDTGLVDFDFGEPYRQAVLYDVVESAPAFDPSTATEDALRFALMYAAAPSKPLRWRAADLAHSEQFLSRVRAYAASRLKTGTGADGSCTDPSPCVDATTHKLRRWRATAAAKITANFESMAMHRATRNLMLLLERIEDYERRVTVAGTIGPGEEGQIAAALQDLLRLLEPICPATVGEVGQGSTARRGD
ncbi:MAG TPA: hypothetical protein VH025_01955, partial [Solirubrobacteraceae bacterium]|nr:hypothetical protein [Solirubrobacteraceae bacterium]